jgi:serralysin
MATIIETTDAAESAATSYGMAVGDQFYGTMSMNESDWVRVTLVAGQTYSFGAIGLGAAASGVTDPMLVLHGAGGAILRQNDDGGPGLSARLTYTAATSGVFHVEVKSLAGAANGGYAMVVNEGTRPDYGADLGAAVLYGEGSSWAETPQTGVALTWGVRQSGPALDANLDPAPFATLSAAQIAATVAALGNFSEVGNVTFTRVGSGTTDNATILVGAYSSAGDGAGAYAWFPGSTASNDDAGDLWINNAEVSRSNLPVGGYGYYVFLHELGHALGLSHPGDYNAAPGVSITYANAAQFTQDSQQFSVMSYFSAKSTEIACPSSYCDTLMLYDIAAVQSLYGVNHATRAGNDVYGFNATVGGAYDFTVNDDPLLCIWDGGGVDTLNLSGFGGRQVIDLAGGAFSDVGGFRGNLSIAVGAVIENAVGGRGADDIYGNDAANALRGGRGDDLLAGGRGADRLTGNAGADAFYFGAGDGRDRVMDFNRADDGLVLAEELWAGTKTAAQVVAEFAALRGGNVVFDFGADELTLIGVTAVAGLAANILIL